mgnify:CR=1 FL=1
MLSAMKNTLVELKMRFKTMPVIYITILLLGSVIFFHHDVPESYMPIILLSSTVVLFLSDYVVNLPNIKKWIVTILTYTFLAQIYYLFLTTYNPLIEQSALSLMYLYLFLSINLYLSSPKNYILEIKTKIIHILISFAVFVATYLCLFLSTFFICVILSKHFDFFYEYSYSARAVNSVTTVAFFSILSLYRKKENYNPSKFFIFVFSRLVPAMLILFLSLSIIYFAKIIIIYDSSIYFDGFDVIPPILTFLLFLSLIMMQITNKKERTLKILFILTILNAITMAIFYLKYAELSSSIHYLLIYLLLASYFLVALLKTKGITYLASYVISLIILIYFIPIIGQLNYKYFMHANNSMYKNNITLYQENKTRLNAPQQEDLESFYYYAPTPDKNVRWIIKNEHYSDILIDVSIGIHKNNKYPKDNHFAYKNYEFGLSEDGKKLIVKNTVKSLNEEFDLYNTKKTKKENEIIEFDNQYFKLILSRYSFDKYSKNITLNIYFYNDER